MDKETKDELREIVSSCSANIMTTVEAQNVIINTKLDGINDHLKHINGTVAAHEKTINDALIERARYREVLQDALKDVDEIIPKVRKLEDNQLSSKTIKKWLVGSVAVMGTLVAIALAVFNLFQHAGG